MSEQQNIEELTALYGPMASHCDHQRGEPVRFYDSELGCERVGTILWVKAPGPSYAGGEPRPITYVIDAGGAGMPALAYPSDIIEQVES